MVHENVFLLKMRKLYPVYSMIFSCFLGYLSYKNYIELKTCYGVIFIILSIFIYLTPIIEGIILCYNIPYWMHISYLMFPVSLLMTVCGFFHLYNYYLLISIFFTILLYIRYRIQW